MVAQFVQHAQHAITSSATTCTVTLGSGTTAGNTLVVAVAYYVSGGSISISGITLGGSAGNFIQRTTVTPSGGPYAAVWEDFNITGSQTSVVVTLSVSGFAAVDVYEVSGLVPTGAWIISSTDSGSGTSWSSGSGYPQPGDTFTVGIGAGPTTVTGPNTTVDLVPWTNSSVQTWISGFQEVSAYMLAYQPETAARNFVYTGTSGSGNWAGIVATFLAPFVPSVSLPMLTAGVTPTQGYMTQQLTQPLAFAQQRLVFRAVQAINAQTIPTSGFLLINFDTILEDPWMISGDSPSNAWVVPLPGYYAITAQVYTSTTPSTAITLQVWITSSVGSTQVGANLLQAGGGSAIGTIWYEESQIDDVINVYCSVQNATSTFSTSIVSGQQSSVEIYYLGA